MSQLLCPSCKSSFSAPSGEVTLETCPVCGAKLASEAQPPRPPSPRRPTALVFGTPVKGAGGPEASVFAPEPVGHDGRPPPPSFGGPSSERGDANVVQAQPQTPEGSPGSTLAGPPPAEVPPPAEAPPPAPAPPPREPPPFSRTEDRPPPLIEVSGEIETVKRRPEPTANTFGLYELISKIGSSEVAVSYRARDRARGRIVALKVLAPRACASREEVSALRERARAARKLEHPNIARVLEVGNADGTDYIATEFIEGHSLADFIADGLSVGEAVVLGGTLASALDYAHSEGVIHGDLRPANVVVDNYGNPRLTDFGFAREYWRVEPEELRRASGSDLPLPHHMPPEQLSGEEPTRRSDVYGLGALIYHMLTGRPPFPGKTLLQVVLEIDRGRPTPPSAVNRRVPAAVSAIAMKCLEKEPQHRFASAAELALEIDKFLRGQKIDARAPGPGMRLVRAVRRRWRAAVAVTVLAAASATGAHFAARSRKVAALLHSVRGPDHEAMALMIEAVEIGRRGSWDEAARRLSGVESDRSVSADVRGLASARLGWVHLQAGRPLEAARAFRSALAARPRDAELRYCLGIALWHAGGDMAEVARELGKSLKLDRARAANARCRYEYGLACMLAGSRDRARAAFERVRRIDPAYKRARVERHLKRLGAGQPRPAPPVPD